MAKKTPAAILATASYDNRPDSQEVHMNKKLKAKWIKALESGKYRRGKGQLKTKCGRFCCLGVLCEVAGKPYTPTSSYLDDDFASEAGISPDTQQILAFANDGDESSDVARRNGFKDYRENRGATFKQIAQYIREKL